MRLAGQQVDSTHCEQVNLAETFKERYGDQINTMVSQVSKEKQEQKEKKTVLPPSMTQKYATPWWYQTYLLTIRNIQNAWRDPRLLISQTISTLLLSGIFATVFLNINNPGSAIQNRAGLLIWMVMNETFTTEYVMAHCLLKSVKQK